MSVVELLRDACAKLGERVELQLRSSFDGVAWSSWRHLCFGDEEVPAEVQWLGERYVQVRVVHDGEVTITSRVHVW